MKKYILGRVKELQFCTEKQNEHINNNINELFHFSLQMSL
jgi:hypothetical protein